MSWQAEPFNIITGELIAQAQGRARYNSTIKVTTVGEAAQTLLLRRIIHSLLVLYSTKALHKSGRESRQKRQNPTLTPSILQSNPILLHHFEPPKQHLHFLFVYTSLVDRPFHSLYTLRYTS